MCNAPGFVYPVGEPVGALLDDGRWWWYIEVGVHRVGGCPSVVDVVGVPSWGFGGVVVDGDVKGILDVGGVVELMVELFLHDCLGSQCAFHRCYYPAH